MPKISAIRRLLFLTAGTYLAAWCLHLLIATRALRGFFGDGALAFLINISRSYVFGQDSRFVHLFWVGFPRDSYLLLNALGIQAALALGISDPLWLKYIFVFWLFALPGLLYLLLLFGLYKIGKLSWGIFPLIGWALISVPVDWHATNSLRWAMPIFWMYFFVVLFADRKIHWRPALLAITLGCLMLGGLYESIVAHAALCLAIGLWKWRQDNNKTAFIYATVAIPGSIRAVLSYASIGHIAPNRFYGFLLPHAFWEPYFFLMILSFCLIAALGSQSKMSDQFKGSYYILLGILTALGIAVLFLPKPDVWEQIGPMRFDYMALTLILMIWASYWQLAGLKTPGRAEPAAIIALLTGTFFWLVQTAQTFEWQACRASYVAARDKGDVFVAPFMSQLLTPSQHIQYAPLDNYNECLWDWTTPWLDLLTAPEGGVNHWSLFTFWQDFQFTEQDGQVVLKTNNWTLTTPALYESEGILPLKTMIYDLTPLYQKLGIGPIVTHQHCLPTEASNDMWKTTLLAIDDNKRRSMFVCPREAQ